LAPIQAKQCGDRGACRLQCGECHLGCVGSPGSRHCRRERRGIAERLDNCGPNRCDRFQFAGNTYLVETINNTASAAGHPALAATDELVKIVDLVNLSGESFASHALTL
jgi:hypothetical protein